jgi:carboxyl-terminal processing protease
LNAIEANYVGTVESDRLVYGAITGMLQTLDPHSSFMDPRTYAQMRERQEGRYYGLGITIAGRRWRDHRRVAVRRLSRVSEGSASRRHHRKD